MGDVRIRVLGPLEAERTGALQGLRPQPAPGLEPHRAPAPGEADLARFWFDALSPYRDQVAGAGATGCVFATVREGVA